MELSGNYWLSIPFAPVTQPHFVVCTPVLCSRIPLEDIRKRPVYRRRHRIHRTLQRFRHLQDLGTLLGGLLFGEAKQRVEDILRAS